MVSMDINGIFIVKWVAGLHQLDHWNIRTNLHVWYLIPPAQNCAKDRWNGRAQTFFVANDWTNAGFWMSKASKAWFRNNRWHEWARPLDKSRVAHLHQRIDDGIRSDKQRDLMLSKLLQGSVSNPNPKNLHLFIQCSGHQLFPWTSLCNLKLLGWSAGWVAGRCPLAPKMDMSRIKTRPFWMNFFMVFPMIFFGCQPWNRPW